MAIKYYDLVTEDWEDWYGELRRGTRGEVNINGAFKKAWDSNPCPHIHDLYGRHPGEPGFDRNHVIEFQPWTSTNSLPSTSGNYYLVNNVDLSKTWTAPTNTNIRLCLNGKDVSFKGTLGNTIIVKGTFSLIDCMYGNLHTVRYGYWNNNAYVITETYPSTENRIDIITGGVITGGTSIYPDSTGDGIYRFGGGVYVWSGYFNMYGGTVAGNKASLGGGIGSYYERIYKYVNILGGDIVGNEGGEGLNSGEGSGAMYFNEYTDVKLSNCNICNNYSVSNHGAVLTVRTSSTMLTIEDTVLISDNVSLDGGTRSYKNLVLKYMAASQPDAGNPQLLYTGKLNADSNIGITLQRTDPNSLRITSGFTTYNPDDDPSDFFFSDDPAYELTKVDGEAALTAV